MTNIWCDCGGVDRDGTVWLPSYTYNGLYRSGFDSGRAELVCRFEDEDIFGEGLYGGVICEEAQVILAPRSAGKIAVYESGTGVFKYYALPIDANSRETRYIHHMRYGESVYMVPMYSDEEIIRYDLEKREVNSTNINVNQAMGWEYGYIINHSIMIDQHIYMVIKDAHRAIEVNTETGVCRAYEIKLLENGLSAGLIDADKKVLLYAGDSVYRWDMRKNRCRLLYRFSECTLRNIYCVNQKLYAFDMDKPVIWIYDMRTGKAETISDCGREAVCPGGWKHIWPLNISDDGLIGFSCYSGTLIKIRGSAITEKVELKGEQPGAKVEEAYDGGTVRTEGYHEMLNLEGLIAYMKAQRDIKGRAVKGSIGKGIFEEIISET